MEQSTDTAPVAKNAPARALGSRLESLRTERGLSRSQLCAAVTRAQGRPLGVRTLTAWERDGVCPAASWIPYLADALGVSSDWLLADLGGA